MNESIALLLRHLDQAYSQATWHGPNLRGSLRGVGPREAGWRPRDHRHTIWEYTLHCAYWKWLTDQRLRGIPPRQQRFSRQPANFPAAPAQPTLRAWKEDLLLLDEAHQQLRQTLSNFDSSLLNQPATSRWTYEDLLRGIANHDLYHAGQIRLLRRLYEEETL